MQTQDPFQFGGMDTNSIPYSPASLTTTGNSGSPFLNSSPQAAKKRSKPPSSHTTTTVSFLFPSAVYFDRTRFDQKCFIRLSMHVSRSNVTGRGRNSQNAKGVAGLLRSYQHMSFLPNARITPPFPGPRSDSFIKFSRRVSSALIFASFSSSSEPQQPLRKVDSGSDRNLLASMIRRSVCYRLLPVCLMVSSSYR
jgi:hypothetical protein